jgi:hypothetical protein
MAVLACEYRVFGGTPVPYEIDPAVSWDQMRVIALIRRDLREGP